MPPTGGGRIILATWTRNDLEAQYRRAVRQGWVLHFREAARLHGFDVADLMGIASRETNMGGREVAPGRFQWLEKLGDNGHGCGLMQVDIGTDMAFKQSGRWRDARAGILRGTEILAEKRTWMKKNAGQPGLVCRFSSGGRRVFNGRAFTTEQLRRLTIAAYNCGQGPAYYHFSTHGNPDAGTTGKDYSADTIKRAEVFRELLRGAAPVAPAAVREAEPVAVEDPPLSEAPAEVAAQPAPAEDEVTVKDVVGSVNVPAETKKELAKKALESGKGRFALLAFKSFTAYELVDWLKLSGYVLLVLVAVAALYVYRKQVLRGLKTGIAWFQK